MIGFSCYFEINASKFNVDKQIYYIRNVHDIYLVLKRKRERKKKREKEKRNMKKEKKRKKKEKKSKKKREKKRWVVEVRASLTLVTRGPVQSSIRISLSTPEIFVFLMVDGG